MWFKGTDSDGETARQSRRDSLRHKIEGAACMPTGTEVTCHKYAPKCCCRCGWSRSPLHTASKRPTRHTPTSCVCDLGQNNGPLQPCCVPGCAEARSTWYLPASACHEIASRDLLHIAFAFGARLGVGRDPVISFSVVGRLVEPHAPAAFAKTRHPKSDEQLAQSSAQ